MHRVRGFSCQNKQPIQFCLVGDANSQTLDKISRENSQNLTLGLKLKHIYPIIRDCNIKL